MGRTELCKPMLFHSRLSVQTIHTLHFMTAFHRHKPPLLDTPPRNSKKPQGTPSNAGQAARGGVDRWIVHETVLIPPLLFRTIMALKRLARGISRGKIKDSPCHSLSLNVLWC